MLVDLTEIKKISVEQIYEPMEFFGFETRNKYNIKNLESGDVIAFAAEQNKGLLNALFRTFLGHWKPFDIIIFNSSRQEWIQASHPFNWYFSRLRIFENNNYIGMIKRQFSLLGSKRFSVSDKNGLSLFKVDSHLFKIWKFDFWDRNRVAARVTKKWSNLMTEFFTDKDKFYIEIVNPKMSSEQKTLIILSAIYIDIMYFENNKNNVIDVIDILGS